MAFTWDGGHPSSDTTVPPSALPAAPEPQCVETMPPLPAPSTRGQRPPSLAGPHPQWPVGGPRSTTLPATVLGGPDTWAPTPVPRWGEAHPAVPTCQSPDSLSQQRGQPSWPVGSTPAGAQGRSGGRACQVPASCRKPAGVSGLGSSRAGASLVAFGPMSPHPLCMTLSICIPQAVTDGTSWGGPELCAGVCVCVWGGVTGVLSTREPRATAVFWQSLWGSGSSVSCRVCVCLCWGTWGHSATAPHQSSPRRPKPYSQPGLLLWQVCPSCHLQRTDLVPPSPRKARSCTGPSTRDTPACPTAPGSSTCGAWGVPTGSCPCPQAGPVPPHLRRGLSWRHAVPCPYHPLVLGSPSVHAS